MKSLVAAAIFIITGVVMFLSSCNAVMINRDIGGGVVQVGISLLCFLIGGILFTVAKAVNYELKIKDKPARPKDETIKSIDRVAIQTQEATEIPREKANNNIILTKDEFTKLMNEIDAKLENANKNVAIYQAQLESKWNDALYEKTKKLAQESVNLANKKADLIKEHIAQLENQSNYIENSDTSLKSESVETGNDNIPTYEHSADEITSDGIRVIAKREIPSIPGAVISITTNVPRKKTVDEKHSNQTVSATLKRLSTIKQLKSFKDYVVIDFETTGFSAINDKAIEVACLKVVNDITNEYHTLINPHIHISSRITNITGITDEDVVGCPDIVTVAQNLKEFCADLPFVAHNASFDMGFLKKAYSEAGIECSVMYVDTLQLSRKAFPEFETHKLEFLINELGIADKQTHRAMDDVLCTKKLLDICIEKIIEEKELAISLKE